MTVPDLPRGLYGVADAGFGDVVAQAQMLAAAGVSVLQLRCKGWSSDAIGAAARACLPLGPRLIVNDDVVVARAVGAWVHLGQGDGGTPDGIPFGRSCHTLAEVDAVAAEVAAGEVPFLVYIGFGPIYGTSTKDTGFAPRGLEQLAAAVRRSPVPVVAIGGITLETIGAVRATGAWGQAVIGDVWRAADPAARIVALMASSPVG